MAGIVRKDFKVKTVDNFNIAVRSVTDQSYAGTPKVPMILMHGLPVAVGTLGLAAVFSAELSAADAVLFMLTTSLSQDLYKRFVNRGADERKVLAVARVTTVVAGALGTALAIVSPTVIGALTIFYTLLGVSLFVPILAGLYIPAAGTRQVLVAMMLGVATVIAVQVATGGRGYGWLTPALVGLAAGIAGFLVMMMGAARAAVVSGSERV